MNNYLYILVYAFLIFLPNTAKADGIYVEMLTIGLLFFVFITFIPGLILGYIAQTFMPNYYDIIILCAIFLFAFLFEIIFSFNREKILGLWVLSFFLSAPLFLISGFLGKKLSQKIHIKNV